MSQKRICLWRLAQPEHKRLQPPTTKHTVPPKALVVVVPRDFSPQQLTQKTTKSENKQNRKKQNLKH
jgi:hypothetical protein